MITLNDTQLLPKGTLIYKAVALYGPSRTYAIGFHVYCVAAPLRAGSAKLVVTRSPDGRLRTRLSAQELLSYAATKDAAVLQLVQNEAQLWQEAMAMKQAVDQRYMAISNAAESFFKAGIPTPKGENTRGDL